ncbi:J domain-containing protein [Vagococcus sp. BWB3-3]|uniref:J domain-containing protein n=1 Tax=Vagococcus allomyrinae TaxID=2794353 RepID=A0A940PCY3_9ENTE|nr:J domain-containing protein [Vagococcus allomyrinae]MBP1042272.1 J domain-containing protein [Vagococcus allomyrinae]
MTKNWEILGIAPTLDKKIIKRAYAKKLKQLDLEKDLQAFQALKAALEACLEVPVESEKPVSNLNPQNVSHLSEVFLFSSPKSSQKENNYHYLEQRLQRLTLEECTLLFWQQLLTSQEWSDTDLRANRLRIQQFVKERAYWLTKDIINYIDQNISLFEFDMKSSEAVETLIELEHYKEVLLTLPKFNAIFPTILTSKTVDYYTFLRYRLWIILIMGNEDERSANDYYQILRSIYQGDLDVEVIYSAVYLRQNLSRLFDKKSAPLFDSYRFTKFAQKATDHPPSLLFYYFNETLRLGIFPEGALAFIEVGDFGFLPPDLSAFLVGMMFYQIKDYQQAFDFWQAIEDSTLIHVYYRKSLDVRRKLNRQAKGKLTELSGISRFRQVWNDVKYWLYPVFIMAGLALMGGFVGEQPTTTDSSVPAEVLELFGGHAAETDETESRVGDILSEQHTEGSVHGYDFAETSNESWVKLFPKVGDPLHKLVTEVLQTDDINCHYDFINQYISESKRADLRHYIYYEKGDYPDLTSEGLLFFEKEHEIYVYSDQIIAVATLDYQDSSQFQQLHFYDRNKQASSWLETEISELLKE